MGKSYRYFSALVLSCLLVCAGFVFLLFTLHPYPELVAVTRNVWRFSEPGTPYQTTLLSPEQVHHIRLGLGLGVAALLTLIALLEHKQQLLTSFRHQTAAAFRHIFRSGRQGFSQLSGFEKKLVYGLFLLLTALRVYYLLQFPLHPDESVSAIAFADRGILSVAGLYHIPNNHIFYNLIAWVFSLFIQDYFWLSRVPALLISSGFLVCSFLWLLRFTAFPVAFLTTALFGFHQNSMYYAVHGRGYYLLTWLAVAAALSLVQLVRKRQEAYWLVFVVASVLGFYTAVTFLYTFAGLLLFGGLSFLLLKDHTRLLKLISASVLVTACVLVLLIPLFALSGPETLYNHKLMEKLAWPEFLVKLPFYLRYISGACLGQETIGFWVYLGLLLTFGFFYLKRQALADSLRQVSPAWLPLAGMAIFVGLAPAPVILVQRLLPYERLLVYKSFFDLLLLSLVLVAVLTLWLKNTRKIRFGVLLIAAVFGLYHSYKITFLLDLDRRTCPPDTIQRALKQYGNPDLPQAGPAQ